MKENFFIKIETLHLPDRGTTENVSNSDCYTLNQRLRTYDKIPYIKYDL
jgi:hypothetical protein